VTASAWLASAFGVAVIVICAVLLWLAGRHEDQIRSRAPGVHDRLSPWAYRLLIFGMFTGGTDVALTGLGTWVIGGELRAAGFLAALLGAGPGLVYVACMTAGLVTLGVAVFGAWLEPGRRVAWWALAVPFVCALSGGHLHGVLTVFPVSEWSSTVASWWAGSPGARG
jgi:hypothetical protein